MGLEAKVCDVKSPSGSWNNSLIRQSFDEVEANAILQLPVAYSTLFAWLYKEHARGGYYAHRTLASPPELHYSPTVRTKLRSSLLLTRVNLRVHKVPVHTLCPLCFCFPETTFHAL
ncbi:hypothetical protein ACOSQ4_004956 [Xanthoceras sorbifolium]